MSSSKTVRKLQVVSPVPADIDIANSVEPLHISEIAQELNLSSNHYDLYGKYKAKVKYHTTLMRVMTCCGVFAFWVLYAEVICILGLTRFVCLWFFFFSFYCGGFGI